MFAKFFARRCALSAVALGSAAVTLAFASPAAARDYSIIARDIVPSGQYGSVPAPPQATQQAQMYNALTPLFDHVTSQDLATDFKPDSLGSAAVGPFTADAVPHAGVTVRRDPYDVPQIIGKTRDDVTWGAGWVIAEDRGLLLEEARYDSLLAAIDAPGLTALNLISTLQTFKPSAQTEREVAKQTRVLRAAGANGRGVLHDLRVYLEGINAYFKVHDPGTAPFTLTDIYAFNALKDQFVGEGGGDEAVRDEFLSALRRRLGLRKGTKVFNDLREANDPEAPVSVPGHVRFQAPPKSTSGNVLLDPNSLSASATKAVAVAGNVRNHASNALLISAKRSSTHHPIMVAGPQIGYFYPGLTLEMDLEGPGISQRGVTSAPFPGYVFIGRNQDSAWSLTSAGLDQIDTYVETLCGHSVHRYIFDGKCRRMQFFNAGTLDPGTKKARRVTFWRTVNGPVIGYARSHGRLVALARKRSSYGKDSLDLLFYRKLADNQVHNVHQFFRAADLTPQTFNSFYIDDRDIGVFTSGLVPIRPRNVDPALPINGNGSEQWRGWVPFKDHPQGINPPSGEIVNWNNRTEAGYEAADDNWALGSVHRVDLLLRNLGHGKRITPAKMVSAMNAAATQDVREVTFEPTLAKLLRGGRAPSSRDAEMLALLNRWYRQGASRLDLTGNGQITAPGAAIMDAAWPRLADAWASSVLGSRLSNELASFDTRFESPPGGQETGWFIYMQKDLRTILGEKVRGKYHVRYCGGGNLRRCRKLMWKALDEAGNALAAKQGPNPVGWHSSATAERISFVPGLLTNPGTSTPFTIAYTNRPSGIQQVMSFSGHAPADRGR
ncbi:MAG: penicillin acylase family protein [Solirubrobacteraceae bacterium]